MNIYELIVYGFIAFTNIFGLLGVLILVISEVHEIRIEEAKETQRDLYVVEFRDLIRHMKFKKKFRADNYDQLMEYVDDLEYDDVIVTDIIHYRVNCT